MAEPATRQGLKDYCLRRLGHPVIDINVDNEQVEDRIDDALQKYREYHFDGTVHDYYKIVVTQTDIDNKYFSVPENMIGITRVFRIGDSFTNSANLFSARYQIHLNDLFNYTSSTYAPYVMAMRHVELLEELFVGEQPIRFNRHTDILYVDMDWANISVGKYVIVDCYRTVNPEDYTDVYNDNWLKKYTTALIKRQWGDNLKKFEGMQLPGGVMFKGQTIWDEATLEIDKMDEEIINKYSLPVFDMIG